MAFSDRVMERAKADKRTIVLAEGFDKRVVQAAGMAQAAGIADVILLANEAEAKELAEGVDLTGVKIIDIEKSDKVEEYAAALYELRKNKGMTMEQAIATVKHPLYYGVMMIKLKEADGMVAGAAHATSDVLRPALQIIKAKKGTKTVSAFFVMTVPDESFGHNGTFIFADSGMVINPTPKSWQPSHFPVLRPLRPCARWTPLSLCFPSPPRAAQSMPMPIRSSKLPASQKSWLPN